MITKEAVLQRIDQLKVARRDQEAQLHGLDGAIQDCEYWLVQLEETADDEEGQPSPVST